MYTNSRYIRRKKLLEVRFKIIRYTRKISSFVSTYYSLFSFFNTIKFLTIFIFIITSYLKNSIHDKFTASISRMGSSEFETLYFHCLVYKLSDYSASFHAEMWTVVSNEIEFVAVVGAYCYSANT